MNLLRWIITCPQLSISRRSSINCWKICNWSIDSRKGRRAGGRELSRASRQNVICSPGHIRRATRYPPISWTRARRNTRATPSPIMWPGVFSRRLIPDTCNKIKKSCQHTEHASKSIKCLYYILRKTVEVVEWTLDLIGIHIQNDHFSQFRSADSLRVQLQAGQSTVGSNMLWWASYLPGWSWYSGQVGHWC